MIPCAILPFGLWIITVLRRISLPGTAIIPSSIGANGSRPTFLRRANTSTAMTLSGLPVRRPTGCGSGAWGPGRRVMNAPTKCFFSALPPFFSEYLPGASRWGSIKLLCPGIARLTPYKGRSLPKEVTVRVGTYGGARFLRDGWSYVEYRFRRWLRWSETCESIVVFHMEPSAGEYVVMLHGAPHGGIDDQHVLLTLNGRKLGKGPLPLRKGFSVVSVRFPGDWLEPEGNTLILNHHGDVLDQVHFPRRLSVLYESIRIFPVNSR